MNDSSTILSSSVNEIYEDYYYINNCHLVVFFFTNVFVLVDLRIRTGGMEPSLVIIFIELLVLVILS